MNRHFLNKSILWDPPAMKNNVEKSFDAARENGIYLLDKKRKKNQGKQMKNTKMSCAVFFLLLLQNETVSSN